MKLLGRARAVHVFGDSHAAQFERVVYSDAGGIPYLSHGDYILSCNAREFTSPQGEINVAILERLLRREILIADVGNAVGDGEAQNAALVANAGLADVPVIFTCGDNDARGIFIRRLAQRFDVILPEGGEPYGFDASRTVVPYNVAVASVVELVRPLALGLTKLKALGLSNLMLHCIVPPEVDDEFYARKNGYAAPRDLRYKCVVLFNDVLRGACAANGIPFIDIWADVTEGGYLQDRFRLDGTHLNKDALAFSMARAAELVAAKPAAWD